MKPKKIHLVYFSATGATARIVSAIGSYIASGDIVKHYIDCRTFSDLLIPADEWVVFGVPVFSGRIPEMVLPFLRKVKGEGTPAILVCTYGNRDFDDALIELQDLVEDNGFYPLSAAAFVTQHSIFPAVGKGHPDDNDMFQIQDFVQQTLQMAERSLLNTRLLVKGSRPYRPIKAVPLYPRTSINCNKCGACVRKCPRQAIAADDPCVVDKKQCASCAACISVCSKRAKSFGGLLYWLVSKHFERSYKKNKESYFAYRQ